MSAEAPGQQGTLVNHDEKGLDAITPAQSVKMTQ